MTVFWRNTRPESGRVLPETGLPEVGLPEVGLPEVGLPEVGLPDVGLYSEKIKVVDHT